MIEWNEKKYEMHEEHKRAVEHDCVNHRDECDEIHPNLTGPINVLHPKEFRPQFHPRPWRNWLLEPKVVLSYFNQYNLRMEVFNLSQAFGQMDSNAKLNLFNTMYEHLLDEDEKSFFLSDIVGEDYADG
jgi:hypothetical protein